MNVSRLARLAATSFAIGGPTAARLAKQVDKLRMRGGGKRLKAARAMPVSLATFHPTIAQTWLAAAASKMLQPHHVPPNSRKLAWWCCPSCSHQFNKRIDLHVAAGGVCPKCHQKPTGSGRSPSAAADGTRSGALAYEDLGATIAAPRVAVAHRCRPDNSLSTLAAPNKNMIARSVADDAYLRTQETRNVMPMLAKNFEKEQKKIAADEVIFVSPKLDGIRCVAAYDIKQKRILFFSRSGTLFDCCDAKIEPALAHIFARDPALVLDGELYNDSVNQEKLAAVLASRSAPAGETAATQAFLQLLREERSSTSGAASPSPSRHNSNTSTKLKTSRGSHKKTSAARHTADDTVVKFEQLTSAIRTSADRRTPAVVALQAKLQYHIFDVLYAGELGADSYPPFRVRYVYLQRLLQALAAYNQAHLKNYDPHVLQLVPCLPCTRAEAKKALSAVMQVGYEGIMIRRDGLHGGHLTLPCQDQKLDSASNTSAAPALREVITRAKLLVQADLREQSRGALARNDVSGGYAYGQRSGALLKYKTMQDDEFVIVSAVEGKGKWKGCLGAFVCKSKAPGKAPATFTVTPATTDAQKRHMWRCWRTKYKGKALTVQYQELTPDGIPRFPIGKSVRGAADGTDWI